MELEDWKEKRSMCVSSACRCVFHHSSALRVFSWPSLEYVLGCSAKLSAQVMWISRLAIFDCIWDLALTSEEN